MHKHAAVYSAIASRLLGNVQSGLADNYPVTDFLAVAAGPVGLELATPRNWTQNDVNAATSLVEDLNDVFQIAIYLSTGGNRKEYDHAVECVRVAVALQRLVDNETHGVPFDGEPDTIFDTATLDNVVQQMKYELARWNPDGEETVIKDSADDEAEEGFEEKDRKK